MLLTDAYLVCINFILLVLSVDTLCRITSFRAIDLVAFHAKLILSKGGLLGPYVTSYPHAACMSCVIVCVQLLEGVGPKVAMERALNESIAYQQAFATEWRNAHPFAAGTVMHVPQLFAEVSHDEARGPESAASAGGMRVAVTVAPPTKISRKSRKFNCNHDMVYFACLFIHHHTAL